MTSSLDHRILDILSNHARLSVESIATQLKESPDVIAQAIHRLESNGTILQYATIIDESKLSKRKAPVRALIEVQVRPEKRTGFDSIAMRIAKFPNVVDHYLLSGGYDFLVIVEGETLDEIAQFVSGKLASLDNVRSTVTHFIMKKYKEKGALMGGDESDERLVITP